MTAPAIDIVIKVGGALLRDPDLFALTTRGLDQLALTLRRGPESDPCTASDPDRNCPPVSNPPPTADHRSPTSLREHLTSVVVVPGGGPFADAVRTANAMLAIGDDASHWAAILAMDQCAHVLVARMRHATLVDDLTSARMVCGAGRIPVLAPYRWVRSVDPLPHAWSVTSDSIAAWVAAVGGAAALLLVKAVAGPLESVTDDYLSQVIDGAAGSGHPLAVDICTPSTVLSMAQAHAGGGWR